MDKIELVNKHLSHFNSDQIKSLNTYLKRNNGKVTAYYNNIASSHNSIRTITRKLRIDKEGLYINKDNQKAYIKIEFIHTRAFFNIDYYNHKDS